MDDETEWIIVETDSDSVRTTKEELVAEDFVLGNEVPVAIDDGNYWGESNSHQVVEYVEYIECVANAPTEQAIELIVETMENPEESPVFGNNLVLFSAYTLSLIGLVYLKS